MKTLFALSKAFNIKMSWQYFATGHGKDEVDGVGGNAKAMVWTHTMSKNGKIDVKNHVDFHRVASANVECLHVTMSHIDARVPNSYWDDCFDVIGIAKIHTCFLNGTNLKFYANKMDLQNGKIRHDFYLRFDMGELGATTTIENDKDIKIGDWVTVSYDDDVFPGEVLQILREGKTICHTRGFRVCKSKCSLTDQ